MNESLKIGTFELVWLNGGRFELDGGAMFGVVPKVLWQKRYPADADNYVQLVASPILVKTPQGFVIIESGLGNKLSDKQRQIFRVREDWRIIDDLKRFGIGREDIDAVILTHFDFDHAGGVVTEEGGKLTLTFPRARHLLQRREWEDVLNPNRRNINTFWPVNSATLRESGMLELVDGDAEISKGIGVIHTGGHNNGHQVVRIASEGEVAIHLGDLLPTHAHFNPLWVMAYDNFPLDAIMLKEDWEQKGREENAWFTFYHDPFMRACRFDEKGNVTERWPLT